MMINLKSIKIFLKFFLVFFISNFYTSNSFSIENKIIFKINDKAFTSLDYEMRLKYLDFVGNNSGLDKKIIIEDFISANLFFEYYKNHKKNNNYDEKINEIYENIKETNLKNKKKYKYKINKNNIIYNLKIDYIRKTILESILNSKNESLNITKNNIDLLYNFKIKYINFEMNNKKFDKIFTIEELNDFEKVISKLNFNSINFFIKEQDIIDINSINSKIKKEILNNNDFFIFKKNNKYSIFYIEKKFVTLDDIVVNLYRVNIEEDFNKNLIKCENLKKNNNIINKEYKLKDLNDKLKSNLVNINDHIILSNNNENFYIVLCDIKFNQEKLNNLNLNKLINSNVKDIEKEFIAKYSDHYNLIF